MAPLEILCDRAAAVALLHPERLRLLQALAQPDSAAGAARRLSMPRQLVNYHLRELEKAGLVTFVEERRKGNCIEKLMRATASSYLMTPGLLGDLTPQPDPAKPYRYETLAAVAARTIVDLGEIRHRREKMEKPPATLSLSAEICFRSASARAEFAEELTVAFRELVAKYNHPGGQRFQVYAGGYPATSLLRG